jgi:hypothetical protein
MALARISLTWCKFVSFQSVTSLSTLIENISQIITNILLHHLCFLLLNTSGRNEKNNTLSKGEETFVVQTGEGLDWFQEALQQAKLLEELRKRQVNDLSLIKYEIFHS